MKGVQQSNVRWVLILLLACLTTVCETHAFASPGITLLDGQHHIYGSATIWEPVPTIKNYNRSSTYDALGGLPALHDWVSPSPDAYAASWADTLSLRVEANSAEGRADAQAEATWLFKPKWSTLELCFNCFVYGDDPTFTELIDQTTGTSLYLWDDVYGPPEYVWDGVTMTFTVDPSHVYSLQANLSVASYSDGGFYSAMNAVVVPVPSALLLGIFGAALVGRWRRR
jgi:hypothetical protein